MSEGEGLVEIFSLSAEVLWDVGSRTLLAPAQACGQYITKMSQTSILVRVDVSLGYVGPCFSAGAFCSTPSWL